MKVRTDFVTNSSSSSFILARKGELTEKQKQAIIEYVEENMLGRKMLTPDSDEDTIQKAFEDHYIDENDQDKIREALKEEKAIYHGEVIFEECEYDLAEMFIDLWKKLEETDSDNFEAIDGSLDY